ncbi:DUF998 domain-containing protein [Aquimonas sp.]|uniref:DUF998 domain-containing protein n=1 Tax=Aquimonas sp. TaxID=1872588 RepID=UPI0037C07AF4
MRQLLLRQSLFLPLAALLLPMLLALGAPGYSSLTQQVSELQLLDHPVADLMRVAPVVCGMSILLFSLGAWLVEPSRFVFTAVTSWAVAANFISAGIFVTGTPLHGLYGVGFFIPLVPACFAAESGLGRGVLRISLAVAVVSMAYTWLNFSGCDPMRGLSQRLAIVVIMGWYSFASYQLLKTMRLAGESVTNPVSDAEPRAFGGGHTQRARSGHAGLWRPISGVHPTLKPAPPPGRMTFNSRSCA